MFYRSFWNTNYVHPLKKKSFSRNFCEITQNLTKMCDFIWRKFGIDLVCFYSSNFASFFVLFCKANWRKILKFSPFSFNFTNYFLVLWRRQSLHLWVNRRKDVRVRFCGWRFLETQRCFWRRHQKVSLFPFRQQIDENFQTFCTNFQEKEEVQA